MNYSRLAAADGRSIAVSAIGSAAAIWACFNLSGLDLFVAAAPWLALIVIGGPILVSVLLAVLIDGAFRLFRRRADY